MPITLVGALTMFVLMHFFTAYVFGDLISLMPEHAQSINRAIFLMDIIMGGMTIVGTLVFLWIAMFRFNKLAEQDNLKYLWALEKVSNHIVITDINGMILYANKGAEIITGYTFEEMKGNTPRLWGGLMPKEFYNKLWANKENKLQVFSGEIKNRRKNQDEYYTLAHITPILDKRGKLTGFVATEEDITKIKELDTAKTEFISIASHQLRTPVSGLNWLIEALEVGSKDFNSQQKQYIKNLADLSGRLIRIIEDLLNFSRIQMGSELMAEKEKVKVRDFVAEFIREITPYADSKKHTITVDDKVKESPVVNINKRSLYNIFQNLVSNAIDYSPANTPVTIVMDKTDDSIKISISNKGPVIPKDEQAHLFERFYRGESAKNIKADGTGLGLYIVKTIIEGMGGYVGFESEEGKDTMFWFTIPLGTAIMSKNNN